MEKYNNFEKIIKKHEMIIIASSFGRDSMVILDLSVKACRKLNKDFRVIWNDTGVEFPEQYRFNKEVIKKYNIEDKLIVAKSTDWTFWKIKDKYGMPIAPRNSRNKEMQRATSSCCHYLKKQPTKEVLKQFEGINYVYLTGLTAEESSNRYQNAKQYGEYFYSTSWKHWKYRPILWWTDKDIDNYIKDNNVPLCDIYSYTGIENYKIRNGCWCCPQAWEYNKGKWMKLYYPKLYEFLIKKTELGEYILNKKLGLVPGQSTFDILDVNHIFDVRPCFFENM